MNVYFFSFFFFGHLFLKQNLLRFWVTVQSLAQEFRVLPPCGNSLKLCFYRGLPQWLGNKESSCRARDAGDMGSTPGSGRSPRGGNGNPLQYSCLENPMDRGAWWFPWTGESHGQRSPWGLKESDATEHARASAIPTVLEKFAPASRVSIQK